MTTSAYCGTAATKPDVSNAIPYDSLSDSSWQDHITVSENTVSVHDAHIWGIWPGDGGEDERPSLRITDCVISEDATYGIQINSTDDIRLVEMTEERKQGVERQRQEREEQKEELRKRLEPAEKKAKKIMLDLIGERKFKVYEETGRVFVRGEECDYIIPKEGLIQRVEKDKIVDLCISFKDREKYPRTDNVIGLKLLAETDEKGFNEIANIQGSRPRHAKEWTEAEGVGFR